MKRTPQAEAFNLSVEFSRVKDGRWMATIPDLPGVSACARTKKDALTAAKELALKAIVERMKQNEATEAARNPVV